MTAPLTASATVACGRGGETPTLQAALGEQSLPATLSYVRLWGSRRVGKGVRSYHRDRIVRERAHDGWAEVLVRWTGNGAPIGELAAAPWDWQQARQRWEADPDPDKGTFAEAYPLRITPLGQRDTSVTRAIVFNGEREVALEVDAPPVIQGSSRFFALGGEEIPPPVWQGTGPGRGRLLASAPARGAVVLRYTVRHLLYRVSYPLPEFTLGVPDPGSGEVLPSSATFGPLQVVFYAPDRTRLALLPVPRAVQLQDVTAYLHRADETPVRETVVVYRQYPSQDEGEPPPPDPITGRTDYMDSEQLLSRVYQYDLKDQNGLVRGFGTRTVRYSACPPPCSRVLATFTRDVREEAPEEETCGGPCT